MPVVSDDHACPICCRSGGLWDIYDHPQAPAALSVGPGALGGRRRPCPAAAQASAPWPGSATSCLNVPSCQRHEFLCVPLSLLPQRPWSPGGGFPPPLSGFPVSYTGPGPPCHLASEALSPTAPGSPCRHWGLPTLCPPSPVDAGSPFGHAQEAIAPCPDALL